MILDRTTLRTSLFGLVGFYNADNPDYPTLTNSLLGSTSGRYVNEVHPLITIENIDQSIKNFSHYNYPSYSAATTYVLGSKVSSSGVNYEYINATSSSGNAPPNATYWRIIDELSDYLIKLVYAGIDEMMDEWINEKKIRGRIKSIYDHVLLYNGIANANDVESNANNFVGLRLRFKKGERSLVTILNKIGTQFNAIANGLTLYLYHSSQQDAIATYTINHSTAKSSQWTTLSSDNTLRYFSDNYDAGGDFYIGYKQSDLEALGANALRMDVHWQELPCDCDQRWREFYMQYSQFVDVVGFEVAESSMTGNKLFDTDNVGITYTNNYGLNLDMSMKCDIGYFVIQEKDLFAEALNLYVAKNILKGLAYNTRGGNQVANQVRQQAKQELFHSTGVWGTVHDRCVKAIKSLSFDLSGLSDHCFPCEEEESILSKRTLM